MLSLDSLKRKINMQCPMCGGESMKKIDDVNNLGYIHMLYQCLDCMTRFDDIDENSLQEYLNKENKKFVLEVVDLIIMEEFWTIPAIERVLEIKQGSIKGWREDDNKFPSTAETTLFRFLKIYPWLLVVADFDYKEDIAKTMIRGSYLGYKEADK